MKRTISVLLAVLLMMSMFAFAETAAPSVTVSQVIVPKTDVVIAEDFTVALTVLAEESVEKKVFDEIVAVAETAPVAEYFGEEVMTSVAAILPAEINVESLVMDEFFALSEENYDATYGDVDATFEFVTVYPDETVLVALVGILPAEDAAEDAEITWVAQEAVVTEGKVAVTFTQDVFESMAENQCVFALLRAEDVE